MQVPEYLIGKFPEHPAAGGYSSVPEKSRGTIPDAPQLALRAIPDVVLLTIPDGEGMTSIAAPISTEATPTTERSVVLDSLARLAACHRIAVTLAELRVTADGVVACGHAGLHSWAVVVANGQHRCEVGATMTPTSLFRQGGERSAVGVGNLADALERAVALARANHRCGQLEIARRQAAAPVVSAA